jgi:hypothetical protein
MDDLDLLCADVYSYISTIFTVERTPPTVCEISEACRLTEHQVKRALVELQRKGRLRGRVPVALLDTEHAS